VNLDACEFPGRDALRKEREDGSRFTFRTFSLDEKLGLEERAKLFSGPGSDQDVIGITTCSSWSWGLEKTLGNASIHSKFQELETAWVFSDEKWFEITLRKGPLLALSYRNEVPAPTGQDTAE
jgi:glycine cleavage system aminomethyltransferase T